MIRTILSLLSLLLAAGTAAARLGDTRTQAEARYGLPKAETTPAGARTLMEGAHELTFENEGWSIRCALLLARNGERYIVRTEYRKTGGTAAIRDVDRQAVLTAEGGAARWKAKAIPASNAAKGDRTAEYTKAFFAAAEQVWARDDGAFARLAKGAASLTLDLPQALRYEVELLASKAPKASPAPSDLVLPLPEKGPPTPAVVATPPPSTPTPAPQSTPTPTPTPVLTPAPSPAPAVEAPMIPWPAYALLGLALLGLLALIARKKRTAVPPRKQEAHVTSPPPRPIAAAPVQEGEAPRSFKDLDRDELALLLGEIYRRKGFQVEISRGAVGAGDADLVLRNNPERVLVQCRSGDEDQVTATEIREFYGLLVSEKAKRGIFVTAGRFAADALKIAAGKPLELIDGNGVSTMILQARIDFSDNLVDVRSWAPLFARTAIVTDPLCPVCRSPMVLRKDSQGEHWRCSNSPQCEGRRDVRRYLRESGAPPDSESHAGGT